MKTNFNKSRMSKINRFCKIIQKRAHSVLKIAHLEEMKI